MDRPCFGSYLKRQFAFKYPFIIKCRKSGEIYRETDGEKHGKLLTGLGIAVIIASIPAELIFFSNLLKLSNSPLLKILWVMTPLVVWLVYYIIAAAVKYKVSKYETIEKDDLSIYPDIKL